jgi:ferredoxin
MNGDVVTTDQLSSGKRKDGVTITVDLQKCIGAGPCAIEAGNAFLIRDEDGKAVIGDPEGDSLTAIMTAAKCCPVKAIIIKDAKGKQQFP